MDYELLFNWIHEAWTQAPCVVLESDNKIIGFWGLCLLKPRWSHDYIIGDYMYYVLPEHRSRKSAWLLRKAVTDFADQIKIPMKLTYLFTGKEKAHIRLFKSFGFHLTGVMGLYRG